MSPSPAVEVAGLVKRYAGRPAVDGLSLAVEVGSVTAVLGPNGAGKTTTLETCEGYRRPDAGRVRVLGQDPWQSGREHRARVGVMLQAGGVYPSVNALEMLRHVASLYAHPLEVPVLAARLGLGPTGRTPFRRLSGGQQQRLSLALAVVGRPEVVFLDEPTAGLDPQARRATWELIEEMRQDGVTVVLSTHQMDEAERLADQVVVVDHGRVVAAGSPAELMAAGSGAGPGGSGGRTDPVGRLRFTAQPGLDVSSLASAVPAASRVEEVSPGRYAVHGAVDAHLLAAVTAWCATHDVMPEGLSVDRRTLEDVFLDLTGTELR